MLDAPALDDLAWSTAGHLAAEVTAGRLKTLEIVEVTLARIRARDPLLNSFTVVTEERARERARALDEARASGKPLGPLAGVPFAAKNLFDIAGLPTIAGSKINRERSRRGGMRPSSSASSMPAPSSWARSIWANTPTISPARTSTTVHRAIRTISSA
jgi:hypothetical protein